MIARRALWAYAGLLAVVPSIICSLVAPRNTQLDVFESLLVGCVGVVFMLFMCDWMSEAKGDVAIVRLTGSIATTLVITAGTLAWSHNEGQSVAPILLLMSCGPWLISGMSLRLSRVFRTRVAQWTTCGAGLFAWILLVRQAMLIGRLVGFGAFGIGLGDNVMHLRLSYDMTAGLFLVTIPMVAFLGSRIGAFAGPRAAAWWVEGTLGLAILGWSYRLTGLLAFAIFMVVTAAVRAERVNGVARQIGRILVVVMCLLRVDVSVHTGAGGHFVPAVSGDLTADGVHAAQVGRIAYVGDGLYNEPKWVWVW